MGAEAEQGLYPIIRFVSQAEYHVPTRAPAPDERLVDWLSTRQADRASNRDLWMAITLIGYCLWTHRNVVGFYGISPSSGTMSVARLFRGSLAHADRYVEVS